MSYMVTFITSRQIIHAGNVPAAELGMLTSTALTALWGEDMLMLRTGSLLLKLTVKKLPSDRLVSTVSVQNRRMTKVLMAHLGSKKDEDLLRFFVDPSWQTMRVLYLARSPHEAPQGVRTFKW